MMWTECLVFINRNLNVHRLTSKTPWNLRIWASVMNANSIRFAYCLLFISWRLRRFHWGNTDRAEGIFGFCWTCVGCGPASGPTLIKALCRTCPVVGRRTNKVQHPVFKLLRSELCPGAAFFTDITRLLHSRQNLKQIKRMRSINDLKWRQYTHHTHIHTHNIYICVCVCVVYMYIYI